MDDKEAHEYALKLFREGSVAEASAMLENLRTSLVAQKKDAQAASVGNDLGVAYYRLDRIKDARRVLEESRAMFETVGDLSGQARAVGNLAQAMVRAGEKDAAQQNYELAGQLFHKAGEPVFEYDTYRALSRLQMQSGHWMESLATYDRALAAKGGSGAFRAFLRIPLKLMGAR